MSVLTPPEKQALHHGVSIFKDPRKIIFPLPTRVCEEEHVMLHVVLRYTGDEDHASTLSDSDLSVVTTTSPHSTFTHLRFTPMLIRVFIYELWVASK